MMPARSIPDRSSRGGGTLDIAGTFAASGNGLQLSSYSMDVESFPPQELFAVGEGQDVVYLFPLKSAKADWGFLAIAQPMVASLEQEAYFTWSALFSQALYQRELVRSLSQRATSSPFLPAGKGNGSRRASQRTALCPGGARRQ